MLKPTPPDPANAADVERYRLDMVAFYAEPERWGWHGGHGPRPVPEKVNGADCYREHGKLKRLSDGQPPEPEVKKAEPEPEKPKGAGKSK